MARTLILLSLWVLAVWAGKCSSDVREKRQEWGELPSSTRKSYIKAVKCMQQKPGKLPTEYYPGARSRMDDFTITHINNTLGIHFNGVFLSWHRHYLWLWEQALKEECGYEGHQPYWNWALSAGDLGSSPEFDGSPTSLSGNGDPSKPYPGNDPALAENATGGCVTTGPFANLQVHLPDLNSFVGVSSVNSSFFNYEPRCFARSFNDTSSRLWLNQTAVDRLLGSPDIRSFQFNMDGREGRQFPTENFFVGPHSAGHQSLGPIMGDFFASPQDPIFFLHHAMVDRTWALWQAQDEKTRLTALYGTSSMFNDPTTPNVTLETQLHFGILSGPRTIGELMSTHAEDFCYDYA